jgi:ABC-type uncharacterized transport system permease subunit
MKMIEHLYLLFYVAGMAFALLDGGFRRDILYLLSIISALTGFFLHAFSFVKIWMSTGIVPSINVPELLSFTSLFLVFIYFSTKIFGGHREIPFFLFPIVVLFLMIAHILPAPMPEIKPYFTTIWFPVHIFLLVAGMALIIFSFIYSTIFIMQDYSLRKKKTPNAMPLPSIDASEKFGKVYLSTGFALLTMGFFSSAIYGILNSKKDAVHHPGLMELATLLSWLTLGAATFGWVKSSIKPKKRAFLVVVGASFFLFIFLGMIWH